MRIVEGVLRLASCILSWAAHFLEFLADICFEFGEPSLVVELAIFGAAILIAWGFDVGWDILHVWQHWELF